jgi:type IV pilus modification protein PilV
MNGYRKASAKHLENQDGFTIVEVLMALVIFSIGIMAIAGMQLSSIRGNSSARIHTEAGVQAQDQIESLMALPYDHANLDPDNSPFTVVENDHTITWEVLQNDTDDGTTENTKTVTVEITGGRLKQPFTLVFMKPEV